MVLFGEGKEKRSGAKRSRSTGGARVNGQTSRVAGLELIHQLNARLTSRRRAVQHSLGTRRRQTEGTQAEGGRGGVMRNGFRFFGEKGEEIFS